MLEYEQLFTILTAEIVFLLSRSQNILVVVKSPRQRTKAEQSNVKRGLFRSIVLEGILFVPASAILLIVLAPLLSIDHLISENTPKSAFYAVIGVISYGFPLATLRQIITRMALNALREYETLRGAESKGGQSR